MEKISVIAITKNGIQIGLKLKQLFPEWKIYSPIKFSDGDSKIEWFTESTSSKIKDLFEKSDALICLFSLGAVIRLISPHLKDKKTDPAVIVIDDKINFVISTLSGHLGGANQLTEKIAHELHSTPVITTAADVNKTIPVDLIGKDFDWKIDDDSTVTMVSALMVNEEKIGVYQESGKKNWWNKELPRNVIIYSTLDELKKSQSKGFLIISDRKIEDEILSRSVLYRTPSLVVGIGLHGDTTKETIEKGINTCFEKFKLSRKSIVKFVSIKKPQEIIGLVEIGKEMNIPIEYVDREDLKKVKTPNPSATVKTFEGTPSVSEAAALMISKGSLIVEKQKFPPDLTIAVARIPN